MKRVVVGGVLAGAVSVFVLMDVLGGYVSTLSLIVFGLLWYGLSITLVVSGVRANRKSSSRVSMEENTVMRGD